MIVREEVATSGQEESKSEEGFQEEGHEEEDF